MQGYLPLQKVHRMKSTLPHFRGVELAVILARAKVAEPSVSIELDSMNLGRMSGFYQQRIQNRPERKTPRADVRHLKALFRRKAREQGLPFKKMNEVRELFLKLKIDVGDNGIRRQRPSPANARAQKKISFVTEVLQSTINFHFQLQVAQPRVL